MAGQIGITQMIAFIRTYRSLRAGPYPFSRKAAYELARDWAPLLNSTRRKA